MISPVITSTMDILDIISNMQKTVELMPDSKDKYILQARLELANKSARKALEQQLEIVDNLITFLEA